MCSFYATDKKFEITLSICCLLRVKLIKLVSIQFWNKAKMCRKFFFNTHLWPNYWFYCRYAAPPPAYSANPAGYGGWVPPTHVFPDMVRIFRHLDLGMMKDRVWEDWTEQRFFSAASCELGLHDRRSASLSRDQWKQRIQVENWAWICNVKEKERK